MQKIREKEENLFKGISKEVKEYVFESASYWDSYVNTDYEYFKTRDPDIAQCHKELEPQPNQRRITPILAKIVMVELPRLTKLEPGRWTVRRLLREALEGKTGLNCPSELSHYTEEQWTRLLDLAEVYFFKAMSDLDEGDDPLGLYVGWTDPDKDKLKDLMKHMALAKVLKL